MILYHYTTMDTFISMMEHSLFHQNDNLEPTHLIMWAGHSSYQNDPTEEPENSSVEQSADKQRKVVIRTERLPQEVLDNE